MPTSSAASTAADESAIWKAVAERWHPDLNREIWQDVPGAEHAVIPEVDPSKDLARRAARWSYPLQRRDLADVALFAAALARTEAESWLGGDRVVATQALEERRHLLGDRILPWAVPWLRALARCFPAHQIDATDAAKTLLSLGERHRPAPILTGAEGLFLPGHDGYGAKDLYGHLGMRMGSLWGGLVVFRRTLESITGELVPNRHVTGDRFDTPAFRGTVVTLYEVAEVRWRRLAENHPGTARYWFDLAARAAATAEIAK